jgi:hypothetical protein
MGAIEIPFVLAYMNAFFSKILLNDVTHEEFAQYRRFPNKEDISRLMEENTDRGFPGLISSVDCMHLELKNCPSAL